MAAGTPASRADTAVALRVGAPAQLAISPSTHRLVVGSGEPRASRSRRTTRSGIRPSPPGSRSPSTGGPAPSRSAPAAWGRSPWTPPAKYDGQRTRSSIAPAGRHPRGARSARHRWRAGRLTIGVRDARLVADGHQSTELRVQAVDRNGTPTAVPGLSWDTPEGTHPTCPHAARRRVHRRVRPRSSPRAAAPGAGGDGVPGVARGRVAGGDAAARAGGRGRARRAVLQPRPRRGPGGLHRGAEAAAAPPLSLLVGGTVGYLSTKISGTGAEPRARLASRSTSFRSSRWRGHGAPLAAASRSPASWRPDMMLAAHDALTCPATRVRRERRAYAPAFGGGGDIGLMLKPGRLVVRAALSLEPSWDDLAGRRDRGQQRRPDRRHRLQDDVLGRPCST